MAPSVNSELAFDEAKAEFNAKHERFFVDNEACIVVTAGDAAGLIPRTKPEVASGAMLEKDAHIFCTHASSGVEVRPAEERFALVSDKAGDDRVVDQWRAACAVFERKLCAEGGTNTSHDRFGAAEHGVADMVGVCADGARHGRGLGDDVAAKASGDFANGEDGCLGGGH